MQTRPLTASAETATSTFLDLVLLWLMIGSGCAALIYQVVWLQLLELIVGSSSVSLGVLLGTFMTDLNLGIGKHEVDADLGWARALVERCFEGFESLAQDGRSLARFGAWEPHPYALDALATKLFEGRHLF